MAILSLAAVALTSREWLGASLVGRLAQSNSKVTRKRSIECSIEYYRGSRCLQLMRLVSSRHQAHHRGYRIEGEKRGEGFLLHVTPVRAGLPRLPWARFRTIRGAWDKAVFDVTRYIDDFLAQLAARGLSSRRNLSHGRASPHRGTNEMTTSALGQKLTFQPRAICPLSARSGRRSLMRIFT